MDVTYVGALIAGVLSFLSPCVLPLVPPYLCFLGGTTFDQLAGEDETPSHVYSTVVLSSVAFVLGFTTVFVSLGATATAAGQLLVANLPLLSKIAGAIIIVAGLHFLGVIHIPILHREARYHADARPAGLVGAYVIGLAFAFGWTPCIGPVLGAILAVPMTATVDWMSTTPGMDRAAFVSIDLMLACAYGLRRIAMWTIPGRLRSST